jgi:TolB-like protein
MDSANRNKQAVMSFFDELKRRSVFRVGVAYVIIAWLIAQVTELALDSFAAPDWVMKTILYLLVIGFPLALLFSWAFELTPEGIKLDKNVDRSESTTPRTGQKLDRIIIAVLLIAVVALLTDRFVLQQNEQEAATVQESGESPAVTVTEKSVAVLPFRAMSNGTDDEYFADGLTEEILNSLAQLPELQVTARTSAFYFKGKDLPITEIATTLGVAHIVEGSVRRDGQRLRITAQLNRAADGFHLWSDTYDRTAEDVFAVQTDIAEKVASALEVVLDDDRRAQMRAAGVRDPQAFIAHQKGLELYALAHPNEQQQALLKQANAFFEQAIERVPDFSDAHHFHSDYYSHVLLDIAAGRQIDGFSDDDIVAARAAQQTDLDAAVKYARDHGRRLNAEFDRALLTGNWQGLSASIDRVLDKPGCTRPLWLHAIALPYDKTEGVRMFFRRQIDCDPLQYYGWVWEANALIWLGKFDAAVDVALAGLEFVPQERLRWGLARALIAAERDAEAEAIIERDLRSEVTTLSTRIMLATARGDLAAARTLLATFRTKFGTGSENAIHFHAWLGDRDTANQMAAEVDARPFGHMILSLAINNCFCGSPFDLEVTPNFAHMLEDAGLPWPPASPIKWPLKNW